MNRRGWAQRLAAATAITGAAAVWASAGAGCDAVLATGDIRYCGEGPCCTPGTRRCDGEAPQRCGDDGRWANEPACEGSLRCFDGLCGQCEPTTLRCAGERKQTCSASAEWIDGDLCVAPSHCQGGVCVVVSCSSGDVRCAGNTPEVCVDQTWEPGLACTQSTCIEGTCQGSCALGEDGTCEGATPMSCNTLGELVAQTACASQCVAGSCPGPSCDGLATLCHGKNCCLSPVVRGGSYNRANDPAAPATISDFRLDQFEVTVGRFRRFVEAYPGSKPMAGAGAHPSATMSGWDAAWTDAWLPPDRPALEAGINCDMTYATWTDAPLSNEDLPINCLSWFEAFAFCAWDGGRLPTEAEWNYAAAAGSEQRVYAWGGAQAVNPSYAVFNCSGDEVSGCAPGDILRVGSKSKTGDGKWGQADLGGSMWEWNLDWYGPLPFDCIDCANTTTKSERVVRGGSWNSNASALLTNVRYAFEPEKRHFNVGVRCARKP